MREIELKYRVDDLEALLAALKARGIELSKPVFQDDQAYAPARWQFGDSKLGVSFLRLRTELGRHYFTLKQPAGNAQDCLEIETQVADRQAMHHAVLHMGYRPTVRIAKTRRIATVDDTSLCIDEVDGLGDFLELERMAPDHADARTVQASLAAFVSSLGIAAARTDQTYDSLVHAAQEQHDNVTVSSPNSSWLVDAFPSVASWSQTSCDIARVDGLREEEHGWAWRLISAIRSSTHRTTHPRRISK